MVSTHEETRKEPKKIHPQKFALWIAIGSIIMMFGGFTSGFIVRRSQGSWDPYHLPFEFYISTAVILFSSLTMHLAVKSFKQRSMTFHKNMVVLTLLLGIAFTVLQYFGFENLFAQFHQDWTNVVSLQFLGVIVLVHALHIIGGIVALVILFVLTFSQRTKIYSSKGIEMIATYWHFVDILWIYLFIFFMVNQ